MTTRILCVEDNPQNMRLVRKILKHAGYTVLEAEDGMKGLNITLAERPDLILMDINLPDIDGLEVTRRIKADEDVNSIPIIALTANAMTGDEEKCYEAGCNGYVSKPISRQQLLEAISEFVE
jgi:two-component system cell cycle response regulator DivK